MKRKREPSPPYFDDVGIFHPRLVPPDVRKAFPLPPLSPRMMAFLTRFETSCYLGCYGFSALSFKCFDELDERWDFDLKTMEAINSEIEKVHSVEAKFIAIDELQYHFYRDDWLMLLEYLAGNMENVKRLKYY